MGRQDYETETLVVGSFEQNSMAGRGTLGWSGGEEPARPVKPQSDHQMIVTHSLRADGFDASEDGTGRGTPLVPMAMPDTFRYNGIRYASTQEDDAREILRSLRKEVGAQAFAEWGSGVLNSLQKAQVLQQDLHGEGVRRATGQDGARVDDSASSRPEDLPKGPMRKVWESESFGCTPQGRKLPEQLTEQLRAHLSQLPHEGAQAESFLRGMWQASEGIGILRQALSAIQEVRRPTGGQSQPAPQRFAVRRLTPREAERLQGFPADYTKISDKTADGPRYKALGNSMAVPVMRWIGDRINMVEGL